MKTLKKSPLFKILIDRHMRDFTKHDKPSLIPDKPSLKMPRPKTN